jgi:Lipocalin-like domain
MNRLIVSGAAMSAVFSSVAAPEADAQTVQDIVGTWMLVSSIAQQDGAKIDTLGTNPSGRLMFGSDGRYALIFVRSDLPKLASNNRTVGTPEENRAIAGGVIAHFGTYTGARSP